ncbi:MAG TPA: DNA-processing protein DprA [bacterium]|nr:DNA-processing protein DprA [bacterium]
MPYRSHDDLKALVLLNRLTAGGGRDVRRLLDQGVPPSEIVQKIKSENLAGKAEALKNLLRSFDPEQEIEQAEKKRIRLLTLWDDGYPALLKQIHDPPVLLYLRGSLSESDEAALAVVGSRHPSFYGLTQAKNLSRELAEKGITIISGMARGIDHAAHEAALSVSYGRSIAVMGCGVDRVYPAENKKIYEALAEKGAVLSEYALQTPPLAENFPRRNRIISGLSLGILVVEAHSRSGSLITAHEGVEQGREVFAVPGPIDQLTSRGTHRLLKEGAALCENAQDILDGLGPLLWPLIGKASTAQSSSAAGALAADEHENRVMTLLGRGTLAYEEMATHLGLSPGQTASLVLQLELHKKICKKPDGRFALAS